MLRLRPYQPCDAETVVRWLSDEEELHKWCADCFDHYPVTAAMLNAYYEANRENASFWGMTAFEDAGPVGHVTMRLRGAEPFTVHLGLLVIDPARRGQGVGEAFVKLTVRFAVEILRAARVTLRVFENNPAAVRCYQRAGFRRVPGSERAFRLPGIDWTGFEMELPAPGVRSDGG